MRDENNNHWNQKSVKVQKLLVCLQTQGQIDNTDPGSQFARKRVVSSE